MSVKTTLMILAAILSVVIIASFVSYFFMQKTTFIPSARSEFDRKLVNFSGGGFRWEYNLPTGMLVASPVSGTVDRGFFENGEHYVFSVVDDSKEWQLLLGVQDPLFTSELQKVVVGTRIEKGTPLFRITSKIPSSYAHNSTLILYARRINDSCFSDALQDTTCPLIPPSAYFRKGGRI